jgi:hypothetical protein
MGKRIPAARFPTSALVKYLAAGRTLDDGSPYSSHMLGPELGIKAGTIRVWTYRDTHLTIWAADKYATHIGVHPSYIWPDYWDREADYRETQVA